jgi:hypothetical protein
MGVLAFNIAALMRAERCCGVVVGFGGCALNEFNASATISAAVTWQTAASFSISLIGFFFIVLLVGCFVLNPPDRRSAVVLIADLWKYTRELKCAPSAVASRIVVHSTNALVWNSVRFTKQTIHSHPTGFERKGWSFLFAPATRQG